MSAVEEKTLALNLPVDMNMGWLLPVGLLVGTLVVVAFDNRSVGLGQESRRAKFVSLTGQEDELDSTVDEKLCRWVDGPRNVGAFWTGAILHTNTTREISTKNYETLAVVQALLLSISVSFYVESNSSDVFGMACCLGCCAFWMGTMSSAFLSVVISSMHSDDQFALLTNLYGKHLMAAPMLLFAWGSMMLFFQLVLYFKTQINENVSYLCLSVCLLIAPLFFHGLHKLSWADGVVKAEGVVDQREARALTTGEIQARLLVYVDSKGHNLLDTLKGYRINNTSAQQAYAIHIFDAYLESQIAQVAMPHKLEQIAKEK